MIDDRQIDRQIDDRQIERETDRETERERERERERLDRCILQRMPQFLSPIGNHMQIQFETWEYYEYCESLKIQ